VPPAGQRGFSGPGGEESPKGPPRRPSWSATLGLRPWEATPSCVISLFHVEHASSTTAVGHARPRAIGSAPCASPLPFHVEHISSTPAFGHGPARHRRGLPGALAQPSSGRCSCTANQRPRCLRGAGGASRERSMGHSPRGTRFLDRRPRGRVGHVGGTLAWRAASGCSCVEHPHAPVPGQAGCSTWNTLHGLVPRPSRPPGSEGAHWCPSCSVFHVEHAPRPVPGQGWLPTSEGPRGALRPTVPRGTPSAPRFPAKRSCRRRGGRPRGARRPTVPRGTPSAPRFPAQLAVGVGGAPTWGAASAVPGGTPSGLRDGCRSPRSSVLRALRSRFHVEHVASRSFQGPRG
jgi:hypothetical protein